MTLRTMFKHWFLGFLCSSFGISVPDIFLSLFEFSRNKYCVLLRGLFFSRSFKIQEPRGHGFLEIPPLFVVYICIVFFLNFVKIYWVIVTSKHFWKVAETLGFILVHVPNPRQGSLSFSFPRKKLYTSNGNFNQLNKFLRNVYHMNCCLL